MSGRVDYMVTPAVAAVTNRAKLHALAVTTTKRSSLLPDVPTMSEAALPGYDMPQWRSFLGPAGISPDIVASLNTAIGRILGMPDVRDRLLKVGSEPTPSSPEEVRKRFADWIVIFGKIAKDTGIKPL